MIKSKLIKKIAVVAMAAFMGACVLGGGTSEAGSIYPGMGKKPPTSWKKPTTPENKPSTASKPAQSTKDNRATWKKADSANTVLRVGLASGVVKAAISSVNGMHILGATDNRDYGDFRSNIVANLSVQGKAIVVNGKNSGASSLIFAPVTTSAGGKIKFNTNEYRGQIMVSVDGGQLLVVNLISLEDYVKGVLPSEMSPSWNMEALKAQAVAARTYALYTKNQKTHLGDGYDLCDSTHCQAYDGISGEASAASAAVDATKGLVMTYQGRPIYAPYHASSGGITENSEDVWGNKLPYLRSVKDDDTKSPYHNWSVKYTAGQVQKLLSAAGKNIGQLKSIAMTTSNSRATSLQFIGSGQTVTLTSQQARQIFGLKSSYFTIRAQRQAAVKPIELPKPQNTNQKVVDQAPVAMQDRNIKVENDKVEIIFDGHGFGHGLGMSQYGAKAMADAGRKYEDILHHYYTDIEIVQWH